MEPLFWSCDEETETLTHEEQDDAIEAHLDTFWPFRPFHPNCGKLTACDECSDTGNRQTVFLQTIPEKLTVFGFTRTKFDDATAASLAERIDEVLQSVEDEELGDPDGGSWHERMSEAQADAVKGALSELVSVFQRNFVPWSCEQTASEEIVVLDWIKANKPEWLS